MEIDLDVNNYNVNELLNMFKLNQSMNQPEIEIKLQNIISTTPKSILTKEYIKFINLCKQKILGNLEGLNITNDNDSTNFNKNNFSTDYNKQLETTGGNHDVINYNYPPVINSYDYKYPRSNLNPVEKRLITKVVCFDTLFRNNYETTNSNDVTWQLPYIIENVISMKLVSIQIPIQYYMFSAKDKNNIFTISLYNMADFPDTIIDIIIPDGNYTIDEFISCINNYFTHVGNGLQYLYFDINKITSRSIIRAKNINDIGYETIHYPFDPANPFYSPNFYFELNFIGDQNLFNNNLNLNAGWLMGFNKDKYTITNDNIYVGLGQKSNAATNDPITYLAYLESEMIYGTSICHYSFLYVNDFNYNNYNTISSLTTDSYIENNILAKFNITGSHNTCLFDNLNNCVLNTREYFGPVDIRKLHVMLLNMYGKPIDLSNNNFSFSLEFTILYTK